MARKTMQDLRDAFNIALMEEYPYIGVEIHIEGFPNSDITIIKNENAAKHLQFFETWYDEELNHIESSCDSFIVDFDYADYVDELKWFKEEK